MYKKLFSLSIVVSISTFNVFSQNHVTKDKTVSKDAEMVMVNGISPADAAKNALNVGAKMPAFTLGDINGKVVKSDDLLKRGNLVVVFYRGAWCPFCNLYLRKLQENLSQIKAQGANLVAISVENPDRSLTVTQKNKVEFTVLSDPNFDVARKFGIVYEMPKDTSELYKSRGLDVAKYNSMEKAELPLSATYIVNSKGKIVYAFLDPDFKKRSEPAVIIETLSKIKKPEKKK